MNDAESVAEMMRQIRYLENSIHQIKIATDKLVKNREMQIVKRTKDNIQLIRDLNLMRINNKSNIILFGIDFLKVWSTGISP